MGPDEESLALADFIIARLGGLIATDRITLAYAIMEWADTQEPIISDNY